MSRITYHVTPTGDGDWKVKAEGNRRASGIHENKVDALGQAKGLAQSHLLGQVIVHGTDGKIQTEYTYDKDPYPPKG